MELLKSHLVYVASADGTSDDLYFIDKDEEQHILELANLAIKSPNNRDKYESAISDCADKIKVLRERRKEILSVVSSCGKYRLFFCLISVTISMAIVFLSLDLGCGDFILTNSIVFFYSFGLTSIVTLHNSRNKFPAKFLTIFNRRVILTKNEGVASAR